MTRMQPKDTKAQRHKEGLLELLKVLFKSFFFFLLLLLTSFTSLELAPAAYKGRFRPSDISARLWLYEYYHSQELEKEDLKPFHTQNSSALDLVWEMEFLGHEPFDDAPLFWIRTAELRALLEVGGSRISYNQLIQQFKSQRGILHKLVTYHYLKSYLDSSNRTLEEKLEVGALASGLSIDWEGDQLKVIAVPNRFPWNSLKKGEIIASGLQNPQQILKRDRQFAEELGSLLTLMARYINPGQLKVIPENGSGGTWLPANVLETVPYNPTPYGNKIYQQIKQSYSMLDALISKDAPEPLIEQQKERLGEALLAGYQTLEGHVYQTSYERELRYPTLSQLKAEEIFYRIPFAEITILLYILALLTLLLLPLFANRWSVRVSALLVAVAFLTHSLILGLRIYILQRAPVSTMFETVVYVPWIAVLLSFALSAYFRTTLPLIASAGLATVLLTVLELTQLNQSFENVQAVLDSQYWLIIHVLMIVGSYGVLSLAGVLGHYYVISHLYHHAETPSLRTSANILLQTLYLGIALLIPGTLLGGVWAAESWGRFWDWDPKESWAFISAGIYLIAIHAYRYGHIGNFGLAIGSIIGLMAISFTWYGVNYILGAGLHTYGFGSGGEAYYYAYLICESLFVVFSIAALQKYGLRKS